MKLFGMRGIRIIARGLVGSHVSDGDACVFCIQRVKDNGVQKFVMLFHLSTTHDPLSQIPVRAGVVGGRMMIP